VLTWSAGRTQRRGWLRSLAGVISSMRVLQSQLCTGMAVWGFAVPSPLEKSRMEKLNGVVFAPALVACAASAL